MYNNATEKAYALHACGETVLLRAQFYEDSGEFDKADDLL